MRIAIGIIFGVCLLFSGAMALAYFGSILLQEKLNNLKDTDNDKDNGEAVKSFRKFHKLLSLHNKFIRFGEQLVSLILGIFGLADASK